MRIRPNTIPYKRLNRDNVFVHRIPSARINVKFFWTAHLDDYIIYSRQEYSQEVFQTRQNARWMDWNITHPLSKIPHKVMAKDKTNLLNIPNSKKKNITPLPYRNHLTSTLLVICSLSHLWTVRYYLWHSRRCSLFEPRLCRCGFKSCYQ